MTNEELDKLLDKIDKEDYSYKPDFFHLKFTVSIVVAIFVAASIYFIIKG